MNNFLLGNNLTFNKVMVFFLLLKETRSWFGLEGLALLISVEEVKCMCLIHPTDI